MADASFTTPLDETPIEVERYELREPPKYRFDADRREFVHTLGAGVMVAVAFAKARGQQGGRRGGRGGGRGGEGPRSEKFDQRFHIDEEGVVTVFTSKVECGQGSRTQITQAAAEEFGLPTDRVRLVMADTELCPDDGGTAGSRTTPATIPTVRRAAAAARELLAQAAAKRLNVERDGVTFDNGAFVAASVGKKLTLAELAADASLAAELAAAPLENGGALAEPNAWKVLGTSVKKVTGPEVVRGAHNYPSDVVRPGMLYGKVVRPPALGATLESIDLEPAKALEGVTVVRDGAFVGCAAKTTHEARKAAELLAKSAKWKTIPQPSSDELFVHLKETANTKGGGWPFPETNEWGDRALALGAAKKKFAEKYEVAYIQHAPMEPRAAVAEWDDGKLTVWTGSQQPGNVQRELCQTFRLPPEKVRVIVPDMGGGFGGKHSGEAAVEAARLAKAAGKPVSLRWTREEEFMWAYFRPAGLIEIEAALGDDGKLAAWDMTNYNSGGSALGTPYRVPNGRTRFLASNSPLRPGSYRALASTANTFARESAMDELAGLAGADSLEFRLAHLDDGRLKDVLVAAAEKFNWRERRKSPRAKHGVGLACGTEKGSFVAACVEVEVVDGRVKLLSVCEAYECGAIQNPGNLRAQVAGAIVMGLGGALHEAIKFRDGKVENGRFSEYRVPRMSDLPPLDIVLVDRPDLASIGAGETPIIAVAPAIANAIAHANGVRVRSMPLLADGKLVG